MIAAMRYWEKLHPESEDCPVYLVWAGLEPLNFTNLFPTWTYRDEIAELNIRVSHLFKKKSFFSHSHEPLIKI